MILFSLRRSFLNATSSPLSLRSVSRFSSDLHRLREQDYMPNSDCRPIALRDRVDLLIRLSDLDAAAKHARLAPFSIERTRRYGLFDKDLKNEEAVNWTCGAIVVAMCKAERYRDAVDLLSYFFVEHKMIPARYSVNPLLNALFEGSSKIQAKTSTLLWLKWLAQEGAFDDAWPHLCSATEKERTEEKVIYSNMTMFCELGYLYEAERCFQDIRSLKTINPNVTTYSTLMDAYVKARMVEDVVRISNLMVDDYIGHLADQLTCKT